MATVTVERSTYRPEIQGLRTIGAFLVAAFHIWGGRVSGGVDVFFVVSGFLITGSLYREIERSQTIDVVAFWGRIAKRVAPMAYLVLALTLLASSLWLPPVRQAGLLTEVFYSAFHLENVKLMMNSVDYLARGDPPSPVQQFWALSVQVQFYAVWPFLLLMTAFAASRLRSARVTFIAALACVSFASLLYSIFQTTLEPKPTYFNTVARIWEFALGGIIAIAGPSLKLPSNLRTVAGWVGLFAVVSCGFVFPPSAHFPGYVALWPTLGAALVLLSGGGSLGFGVGRLLASRPLVALGDISFSFYLWHWPVLIFCMVLTGHTRLGMLAGTAVIAIALCGAYCTHRWVEQPINRSTFGKQTPWHGLAMGVGLAVPVLAISTVWLLLNEAEKNRQREAADRIMAQYTGGAAPMSLETAWTPGVPVYPTPRAVRHKHPNHCQQKETKSEVLSCSYGVVEGARKTIALVGGSHAEHWLPALEKLAHEYKWRIVAITKSACALIPNRGHQSCVQWNNDVDEALVRLRPDVVFTTSTRRGNPSGASIEYVPEAYLKYWADWEKNNITVIAIRDSARTRKDAFECIERSPVDLKKCSMPRKDLFDQIDPTSRLNPKPANVSFIDLTDRFCDLELCSPVGGNVLVYRDTHHITIEYSRTLADPLGERMKQVRPDLFLMEARDNSPRHQSADAGEGLEGTAVKQH